MAILHTVNKSPFEHNTLESCLKILQPDDTLLLIEDGVYACLETAPSWPTLQSLALRGVNLRVLQEDAQARGIDSAHNTLFQAADYAEFVSLCTQHASVQSWF